MPDAGADPNAEFTDWQKRNDFDEPFARPAKAEDARPEDVEAFKRLTVAPGVDPVKEREFLEQLKAKYPNTYAHLTVDEMLIIRRYTGPDYGKLNTALRTGQTGQGKHARDLSKEELKQWKSYERALNAALSKLPKYRGPVIRGGNLPPHIDKKYAVGKKVSDKAFLSSCVGTEPPLAFVNKFEFHIFSKNGRPIEDLAMYGSHQGLDVTEHKWDPTTYPDGALPPDKHADETREAEVLFASGTKFKVMKREQIQVWETKTSKWETKTYIYMVERD